MGLCSFSSLSTKDKDGKGQQKRHETPREQVLHMAPRACRMLLLALSIIRIPHVVFVNDHVV
jgi:hypothetical protein